jgi:hypothetical protein
MSVACNCVSALHCVFVLMHCFGAVPAGSAVKASTFKHQEQQQQQAAAAPTAAAAAAGSSVSITGLSSPAGDRFNVELTLTPPPPSPAAAAGRGVNAHAAAAAAGGGGGGLSVRVRLDLAWLPSMPSQVLQALQEVLSQQRYLQLLGACLMQPGEDYPRLSVLLPSKVFLISVIIRRC